MVRNDVRPYRNLPSSTDLATSSLSPSGSRQTTITSPVQPRVNDVFEDPLSANWRRRGGLPSRFGLRSAPDFQSASHASGVTADVDVDPGPFSFRPSQLSQLIDAKDIDGLCGVEALLLGLGTNSVRGLIESPDNPLAVPVQPGPHPLPKFNNGAPIPPPEAPRRRLSRNEPGSTA
ncbi:uncharacterized protein BXZ73DRAFT_100860 [Epithele typhae]|uniref:uncharacterized protein n=1 Tax=Epithele typhae TaxID=378194 RepID=UPI00200808BB|nr:uncharacterized protein BXZ73DRAFT_100860 [Epithele typhae]KAH9934021.1 hypothetical protein BXZ73DRAFT_100860 [Epithele typhae]